MRIPIEMRRKMIAAVERGEPVATVAKRFEVSERGLRKLIQTCAQRGSLVPEKTGPKSPIKLTPDDDAKMLGLIAKDAGITLDAIREKLSVEVAVSTVCRRLKKLGLTLKKSR